MLRTWAMAGVTAAALWSVCETRAEEPGLQSRKSGQSAVVGGKQVTIKEIDITPVLKNEFSGLFDFECFDKPAMKELREKYELEKVVAAGKDEFEQQAVLNAWVNRRITFGAPKSDPKSALAILQAAAEGKQFNCGYFARTLRETASALGWVARDIGLKGAKGDGNGIEHSVVEIWSNQHRKWIMFDPTSRMYVEKAGIPANSYEIRQDWFYNDGKELTFVLGAGADQKKYTKAQLPIDMGTFAGFGKLSVNPLTIGKFLFIAYTPANKDGSANWGTMFITKDAKCEGVTYHNRKNPKDPAVDPYWPMNQSALKLTSGEGLSLKVAADTMTPNFDKFRTRIDGKEWTDGLAETWTLHPGSNTLEVVALNKFGRQGVIGKVVLEVR